LSHKAKHFRAGSVSKQFETWQSITKDRETLQSIKGIKIPVTDMPETSFRSYPDFKKGMLFIDQEIDNLLLKGVITPCGHEIGEYISPIFVTEKADGGFRLILNLKQLNKAVEKKKFKMQTLSLILCLIRPNMYLAKLDIKDAYYSIPISEERQKLLKFEHRGVLYKFIALPNGYTE